MTYEELAYQITTPVVTFNQIKLVFSEPAAALRTQLTRWVARGKLNRLKRGVYWFPNRPIDELAVCPFLYEPSYISLETALQVHGLIPDIPAMVTSVTPVTPNRFETILGAYAFYRLAIRLFFGFNFVTDAKSGLPYRLADPEKALLDWIYLRKIDRLAEYRSDLNGLDRDKLTIYAREFPAWVKRRLDA